MRDTIELKNRNLRRVGLNFAQCLGALATRSNDIRLASNRIGRFFGQISYLLNLNPADL